MALFIENPGRYLEFAQVCRAIGPGPTNHKILHCNGKAYEDQHYFYGSFGRGYCRIFHNEEAVTVAFRGTREFVDWSVSNIRAYPVALRDCGAGAHSVKVHRGFQNTLDYIDRRTNKRSINSIIEYLKEDKLFGKPLYITGHSLGGALATLFAVKYRSAHPDKKIAEVINFGAPAVGGSSFYRFYDDLHDRTTRIVNRADAVPFTPPIGYKHVGNEVWIGNGPPQSNARWPKRLYFALGLGNYLSFKDDHSIKSYIECLEGYC